MKRSRILTEVHESAAAMHRSGVIDRKTMREFDALTFPPIRHLSPKQIAAKLSAALQDPNPRIFLRVIATVIESIGVDRAAQRLGLTPPDLARIIGPKSKPSYEEVRAVVNGLGFRLGIDRARALDNARAASRFVPRSASDEERPRKRHASTCRAFPRPSARHENQRLTEA